MILKFSLVGKSPGRVCRVDVEGDVVRREYGHARRRCHGLRGKRFTVSRPRFFRPLLSSCFLGERLNIECCDERGGVCERKK